MDDPSSRRIGVVIATWNRRELLRRALGSLDACIQDGVEVTVIDNGSTDGTESIVDQTAIRYIRLASNLGPGPARDAGIEASRSPWVLIMDDDDTLIPGALGAASQDIEGLSQQYPVVFFATSTSRVRCEAERLSVGDLTGGMIGDCAPVVNKALYASRGYQYPALRIGGEGLLWLRVAQDYGIPVFHTRVIQVYDDAPGRLTATENQIDRSREYALLQDMYLEQHYGILSATRPEPLLRRYIGSATYWKLSGDSRLARRRLSEAEAIAGARVRPLFLLTLLPRRWFVWMFRVFRATQKLARYVKGEWIGLVSRPSDQSSS